jgi:predicted histidine transporter YuiF (NhaC family)
MRNEVYFSFSVLKNKLRRKKMDVNKLTAIVTILITLSIASERLVEIIKGFIPFLNADTLDNANNLINPNQEARRKAYVSILSVFCGIATAFLASPILAGIFKDMVAGSNCQIAGLGENTPCGFDLTGNGILLVLALGLLAAGGSKLWNSVLEYLLKIKDLKKAEANRETAIAAVEIYRAKVELAVAKKDSPQLDSNP